MRRLSNLHASRGSPSGRVLATRRTIQPRPNLRQAAAAFNVTRMAYDDFPLCRNDVKEFSQSNATYFL